MFRGLRSFFGKMPFLQRTPLPSRITTLPSISSFPVSIVSNPFLHPALRSFSYRPENALVRLIEAVQKKDTDAIAILAKATPRLIVEQTHNDNTALHEAARLGDVEMIEILSKAFSVNFNVNHKCHCLKKRTPLAYAAEGGHSDAIDKLFSLGADPNITDEKGWSAMDYALSGYSRDNAKFEVVVIKIHEKNGKANIFIRELAPVLQKLEAQKTEAIKQNSFQHFLASNPTAIREKVLIDQKDYVEELKKRKALPTPRKPS